jgi:hypothetical protein
MSNFNGWCSTLYKRKGKEGDYYLFNKNFKLQEGNIIICRELDYRNYKLFSDYLHVRRLINGTENRNLRCYYEILFGNNPRKIYFDLDCKVSKIERDFDMSDEKFGSEMIDCLKEAILNEIIWRNYSTYFWVNFKVFGAVPITLLFIFTQAPFLMRNKQDNSPL